MRWFWSVPDVVRLRAYGAGGLEGSCLCHLLRTDGDDESETDVGDADEVILPATSNFVRRVYIAHGWASYGVVSDDG